jgi:hypothetical protein
MVIYIRINIEAQFEIIGAFFMTVAEKYSLEWKIQKKFMSFEFEINKGNNG